MLLPFLFLLAASLCASTTNEETKRLPVTSNNELPWSDLFEFDDYSGSTTPWNRKQHAILLPYLARKTTPHAIIESEEASGDWFGQRTYLINHGVNFSLTYTSDTVGNPVGGYRPGGCAYADVFVVACLIETEKLFGWHGGYFTISAMELDGQDLSSNNIGNTFFVQQTYAVETIHFNELFYEQHFLDDRVSLKFGRIVASNEFAISPLAFLYMNAGINSNPEALWLNGKVSSYFNSVWGSRLKLDLPHSTTARLGAYQVTPFSRNGMNWNFYPENGVMLLAQYGWSPEFFQPSVSFEKKEAKQASIANGSESGNSSLSKASCTTGKGFSGHYWMGGYYSTATYTQFNSSIPAANSYGLYWHADQVVYKPNLNKNVGLTLWSDYALCPQENISQLPFEVNAGAIYTGLIPGRENDFTTLGVIYGDFSSNYANAEQQNGNGYPTYELVFESGYRIHLTNFSYVQPDLQWIIRPGGTGNIPNALVLGMELGVVF